MVPSGAESMKLVVQIDDMMRKKDLSLSSIDSKDAIDKSPVSNAVKNGGKNAESIFLSIKARGSYKSFRSFIEELEKVCV